MADYVDTKAVTGEQFGFNLNYSTTLPTNEELVDRFREAVKMWRGRNQLIKLVRDMIEGKNRIPVPKKALFAPRVARSYLLAASINEKRARFMNVPEVAVIPDGVGVSKQSEATEIERALNSAMLIMDRNGQTSSWDRAVLDSIALDEGVELIERAPAAFWPELVVDESTGRCKLEMVYQDPEAFAKAREEYKKISGLPIRSTYVPLESFFPIYEGNTIVECFHVEYRSLRSVLANRMFKPEARAILSESYGKSQDGGLSQQVMIIRYCNRWWYGYYAALPPSKDFTIRNVNDFTNIDGVGSVVLLMAYEHAVGRVLYNTVPGRFGGWKTGKNGIEPVMNALCELNQTADILLSQIATTVGARSWPNLKQIVNPEYRSSNSATTPRAIAIEEGQPIVMYPGEDIRPIFSSDPDPMAQWLYSETVKQFHLIAGSMVLYGSRETGVDSGYQHNLQITQSEHLDEKIEMNLSESVINRCEIIAGHIKAMNETVWVASTDVDRKENRKLTRYIALKPEDLYPMPRIDARVRKPKPIDFLTALRAARDASANRYGPGTQLLSDETIYEQILNIAEPDTEMRRIWMQNVRQRLLNSDYIINKITERLNMKFFEDAPPLNTTSAEIDPALLAAMQQGINQTIGDGGVSPEVARAVLGKDVENPENPISNMVPPANQQPMDSGVRREGGTPYGSPQMEQVIANAIRSGMAGGRRI